MKPRTVVPSTDSEDSDALPSKSLELSPEELDALVDDLTFKEMRDEKLLIRLREFVDRRITALRTERAKLDSAQLRSTASEYKKRTKQLQRLQQLIRRCRVYL